ncbi:hypothetical protein FPHYL_12837 [Fusarium phyllophilum]|uniref:Uncharacterized protein n=1 Tax=Fusarium phyllophilum TaxID=47803 RepID=A0A8H5IGQ4_9HYPO|nr:hypothetical protein FPHYL_12837 [Fusarium phyllophilum]
MKKPQVLNFSTSSSSSPMGTVTHPRSAMESLGKVKSLAADAVGQSNAIASPIHSEASNATVADMRAQNKSKALQTYQSFLCAKMQLLSEQQTDPALFPQCGDAPNKVLGRLAQIGLDAVSCLQQKPRQSFHDVYTDSVGLQLLSDDQKLYQSANHVIFVLVGWLTMLYNPQPDAQMSIFQDGFQCFQHRTLTHPLSGPSTPHTRREIAENMMFLGLVIPKRLRADTSQDQAATSLDARLINAATICEYAGVEIEWSTSLFSHLSFDESRCRLTLFALPSFCLLHNVGETSLLYSLHETIATLVSPAEADEKAMIDGFLREVLLSLHIFFGADKRSRKYFKSKEFHRSKGVSGIEDPILTSLCTQRKPSVLTTERLWSKPNYSPSSDFPILSSRLARIQAFSRANNPNRGLKLWSDRRDLNLTYTYRAVIVFGTIGVILSLAQTCLSAAQLKYSMK